MRSIKDFVPIESKDEKVVPKLAEARSLKRDADEKLDQGRSKKQKISKSSEPRNKDVDELSQEELHQLMIIVPKQGMNVKALQTKYPIIDWEIYTEDTRKFWKIIRDGNHTEMLCVKLLVEEDSEMYRELSRKIFMQVIKDDGWLGVHEDGLAWFKFELILDTVQLETIISTISHEYLLKFTSEYGISEDPHPELPGPEERIVDFSEGKLSVIGTAKQETMEKHPSMLYQAVGFPKNWNNRFFWVDERIFLTVADWRTSAPNDEMLGRDTYSAKAVTIQNTHRTPSKNNQKHCCV
uniref:Uncharacterized protein n=1 Tax=Tanacetum cinerariifolium TaxID=118510 RepID=A0A6L2KAA5_TANCI|nr:hypothetical protein [Tanacetum cinerariifolium]